MNSTLNVFAILLVATLAFNTAINYMADNIEDFESVPLPPKKLEIINTHNPMIKVDATSRSTWTLVDFSTGKTYTVKDINKEKNKLKFRPWDLGFQRTKILTNSGLTNPRGTVGVNNLGPVDIDSVEVAPTAGYVQDARSYGKVTNKAISNWYLYRTRTHNVESQKNVYAIRMADGGYMKMRILNYYCGRQESECKSFMCTRQEAACYAIEYVLPQNNGGKTFPPAPVAPVAPAAPALSQSAALATETVN